MLAQAPPAIEILHFTPPQHLIASTQFKVHAQVTGVAGEYDLTVVGDSPAYDQDVFTTGDITTDGTEWIAEVSPSATATYHLNAVTADGTVLASSRPFTVVAHPLLTLKSRPLGGGLELRTAARLLRGKTTFKPRRGSAREAVFYYQLDGSDSFKELAREPLAGRGCCTRRATHTIYDTSLLSGIKSFRVCFPGRLFAGAGKVGHCPSQLSAR